MKNISTGTIIRTIILVLALVNQILASTGHAILDIDEGVITQLVNCSFTVIAAVIAWWKNNSFTSAAIDGDRVMRSEKGSAQG